MDIRSARREGIARLVSSPTPALDTDVILEHITGRTKSFFISHSDDELSEAQLEQFRNAIARRCTGLPVAYITGHKEFYGIDFIVTPDVLIPKPDTELMVEHALSWFSEQKEGTLLSAADICTGSGCIGISVASCLHRPAEFVMTDISSPALAIAQENAHRIMTPDTLGRTTFLQGDLLDAVPANKQFNLIMSNPPYIPSEEVTALLKDGRNEPRLALDGDADSGVQAGSDGLAIARRLIPQAYAHLADGGMFMIETGEYNAAEAASLIKKAGFSQVTTYPDLAGQPRLTTGIRYQSI